MTVGPTLPEPCQLFEQLTVIFALEQMFARFGPAQQFPGGDFVRFVVLEVAEFLGPVGRAGVELSRCFAASPAGILEEKGGAVRTAGEEKNN